MTTTGLSGAALGCILWPCSRALSVARCLSLCVLASDVAGGVH
jgi:hypothetical protein